MLKRFRLPEQLLQFKLQARFAQRIQKGITKSENTDDAQQIDIYMNDIKRLSQKLRRLEKEEKQNFYEQKVKTIDIQMRLLKCTHLNKLFNLYDRYASYMNHRNMICLLTQYQKLVDVKKGIRNKEKNNEAFAVYIDQILDTLKSQLNTIDGKNMLIIYWSLAKMDYKHEINASIIKEIQDLYLDQYTLYEYSLLLWCLAKNNVRDQELLASMIHQIIMKLKSVDIDKIVLIDRRENNLDEKKGVTVPPKVSQVPLEEEDNLDLLLDDYLDEQEEKEEEHVSLKSKEETVEVGCQSISMILWAMGSLRIKDEELFTLLYDVITLRQDVFSIQQLGMILQMHCTLKLWSHSAFSHTLITCIEAKLRQSQGVLTLKGILTNLPKLRYLSEDDQKNIPVLILKIAKMILDRQDSLRSILSGRFCSELAWHLGHQKIDDAHLWHRLSIHCVDSLKSMKERDLVMAYYGFCLNYSLGHRNMKGKVISSISYQISKKYQGFSSRSQSSIQHITKQSDYFDEHTKQFI